VRVMQEPQSPREYCDAALARLSLPDLSDVKTVLGAVLERRCASVNPACSILSQLALDQNQFLRIWKDDCCGYLRFLRDKSIGSLKAQNDLMGRVNSAREEFDSYVGDFDAEMCTVRELGEIGYSKFDPMLTKVDAKTVDYRATYESHSVAIEVKNLRAPITILDVFASSLRMARIENASSYALRICLTYYSDNTVTKAQREEIVSYLRSVAGRTPPFSDKLDLSGGVEVRVRVESGAGEAMMSRGEGFERRGEVSLPGFLNKVEFHARTALSQFATEWDREYVIVFNINSPSGAIWSDFLNAAAERVYSVSGGSIRSEFLLHGHRIAPDNV
jgi:hypothetical protein